MTRTHQIEQQFYVIPGDKWIMVKDQNLFIILKVIRKTISIDKINKICIYCSSTKIISQTLWQVYVGGKVEFTEPELIEYFLSGSFLSISRILFIKY